MELLRSTGQYSRRILVTLAWRYLWRNYRRTIIMLLAITIGVWAMIFMIALLRGMVDDMVQSSLESFLGHVQIHHPSYRDDPSIVNHLPTPGSELREYLDRAGLDWTARLRVPAVVSSERESLGVTLMGVKPDREVRLSKLPRQISNGRFLESPDDPGIVIGEKLARRLETGLGKRIVVMSQDPDNDIADRGFRIVGIYFAELPAMEEQFVFVGLNVAQQMLRVGESVSEIEVQGPDFREVDWFYQAIARLKPDLDVSPWYERDTYLGTMLRLMDGVVLVWIIVIFLALSFGLVNTLVMAVFERVREIGLILALGMRPSAIMGQVLLETLMLLALGLALGNALALATIIPLADGIDLSVVSEGLAMMGAGSTLYPALYWQDLLLSNGLVIALGLLAGLAPAHRASRYNPVEALTKT
ncbi:ABC transporter permease [Kineobactrum sediminis]|uniref:ABC transporter permease n=1 Tax=Kineobactrum sediminis TaxID=1905677 RepID=A0A2N5Y1A2_9GAMM|nr:ABC transporter permease [Kineobactrum sediminis]PLW82180.1 ABC transporter permease [Kineobactrum sediminis]